ncbi:9100_t:CDS:10 [Acaulospora morrowiae]|uniref:9100_t:CDS:1 n=1 Tax=Acaulospora morrowiae TaxID=94023 RepID=A0A9N8ZEA2_9GLOM|nr:9100_t:CDS:10 [Acaulospora morrowiae]
MAWWTEARFGRFFRLLYAWVHEERTGAPNSSICRYLREHSKSTDGRTTREAWCVNPVDHNRRVKYHVSMNTVTSGRARDECKMSEFDALYLSGGSSTKKIRLKNTSPDYHHPEQRVQTTGNVDHTDIPGYFVILENVFGLIGTVFWSFQLVPQVYKNWRSKSTRGLSAVMMLLWTFSGISYGIYAIIIELSIPLMIQPQLFGAICLICFTQCLYYEHPKFVGRKAKSGFMFLTIVLISAVVQTTVIYGIKAASDRDIRWPETLCGIIPVVFIITGFIPQYYEIYRKGLVCGISLLFMTIDILGAIFSTISLAFRPPPFDTLASVCYISVFILDSIIVLLYYLLKWLHEKRTLDTKGEETREYEKEGVVIDLVNEDDWTVKRGENGNGSNVFDGENDKIEEKFG